MRVYVVKSAQGYYWGHDSKATKSFHKVRMYVSKDCALGMRDVCNEYWQDYGEWYVIEWEIQPLWRLQEIEYGYEARN